MDSNKIVARLLWVCVFIVIGVLLFFAWKADAYQQGKMAHEQMIYPIVRVTTGMAGGSGTIIYSKLNEKGTYNTYVLTNYHVISNAIRILEEWDSDLQKNVKKEKRSIVYVEVFKYRNLSTPIGTLKVEAEIVLYNEAEDMALIKLRSEEKAGFIAKLYPLDKIDDIHVMDETVAVGCSLGFPPIPTIGVLTRLNYQIESLPYHMSSSQIIYGNSGGAMFLDKTGELIGIPSLVPIVGWGSPVSYMGLFIPINRIYKWFEKEHYDFIYDDTLAEKDCLEKREQEIKAKIEKHE